MIVTAAIRSKGCVYAGRTHADIVNEYPTIYHGEHGFITDTGEFLNRYDAAEHAYESGQIPYKKYPLFHSDLKELDK